MTSKAQTFDRRRVFGSLNTGRDISALADDECPVLRNVEHGKAGALTKRLGRFLAYEVATQPEVTSTPLIESVNDAAGTLPAESEWDIRFTYRTVAGETDDIGATMWTPQVSLGDNALDIRLPFHMRQVAVDRFYKVDSATVGLPPHPAWPFTYMIRTDPQLPLTGWALADPAVFEGFLVYSRAPRVQDETRLGANYLAATPLYDRLQPLAKVYSVGTWDGGEVFVLDRQVVQIGEMGKIDRDSVDIMLPQWERTGLPIKYVNVYAREAGSLDDFEWIGYIADGMDVLRFKDPPSSDGFPPSVRVDREPLTVAAVEVRDDVTGRCGGIAAPTNIPGGILGFRHTWSSADPTKFNDPGWDDAWQAANLSGCQPHLRCEQETWPSTNVVLALQDDQGIEVTRPDAPTTVSGWSVYGGRLVPHRTLDWSAADFHASTDVPFAFARPGAQYSGRDSRTAAQVEAFVTEAEVTTGSMVAACSNINYAQWPNSSVIISGALDPFDQATRGFRPGYDDIRLQQFSYASSRDDVHSNRHIYWQELDSVTDADDINLSTHGVINITLRVRPGLVTDFDPNNSDTVMISIWNQAGPAVVPLRTGIGLTGGAFATLAVPFAWASTLLVPGIAPAASSRFLGIAVSATDGVGFDVDKITLDLMRANADASVWNWTLQTTRPLDTETVTFKHPLARGIDRNDSLRMNPSAMWPVNLPRPELRFESGCNTTLPFGCADSCFIATPSRGVERIYQYEGIQMQSVAENDWRFNAYYGRLFMNNAGRDDESTDFNLRFDGRQTFGHGIDYPRQRGEISSVNEPAPGAGVTENIDIEYYLDYRRTLEALRRGYNARSAPGAKLDDQQKVVAFADTEKVNVKDDQETVLVVEGNVRPEPQVTHLEINRNKVFTADYYRTDSVPIEESVVAADGSVNLRYEDGFNALDGDLTLLTNFETGRPPSAAFAFINQERFFFVGVLSPGSVGFTNVTSPAGDADLEGFYILHTIEPDIPAPLTCLSPYGDGLVASSNGGMVPMVGISDDDNSSNGISWGASFADTGWVGPDAWVRVNATQYGMTQLGPGMLQGGELKFIGHNVRGTVERFQFSPEQRASMRCIQNSALQRTQVWFTLADKASGCMDEVLILDEESLPEGLRRYWALWTEMDVHGLSVQKDATKRDAVWCGGQKGRIYGFGGRMRTDAGLFIECQGDTKPLTEGVLGKTFMPRRIRVFIHGSPEHSVLIDYRKDMETRPNVNPTSIRVRCNDLPDDTEPIGDFLMGGGAEWGTPDQHLEIERRRNIGRLSHQIQLTVRQSLDDQPVGEPRESTFQMAGYLIDTFQKGQRRTK